jgi:hypothetical protein
MCCGTAVIASDRGALPEVVRHGETGIIFPLGDPGDLVRVLTALDRTELDKMGKAGQQRYQRFYTARVMNERLEILYRLLAGGRGLDEIRKAIGKIETNTDEASAAVAERSVSVIEESVGTARAGVAAS